MKNIIYSFYSIDQFKTNNLVFLDGEIEKFDSDVKSNKEPKNNFSKADEAATSLQKSMQKGPKIRQFYKNTPLPKQNWTSQSTISIENAGKAFEKDAKDSKELYTNAKPELDKAQNLRDIVNINTSGLNSDYSTLYAYNVIDKAKTLQKEDQGTNYLIDIYNKLPYSINNNEKNEFLAKVGMTQASTSREAKIISEKFPTKERGKQFLEEWNRNNNKA